jgi:hypothetical protein
LLQEDAPGVSQGNVLPAAIEQLRSDQFFELTDLLAQRRLSRAQAGGGAREVELFGHRNEVPEMSEFHVLSLGTGVRRDYLSKQCRMATRCRC